MQGKSFPMRCLLLFMLLAYSTVAQPLAETQKLVSLCTFWGFLKYHHPAVTSGKLDWDERCIRLLPAIRQAPDRENLSTLYEQVLDELGPVRPCRSCLSDAEIPVWNRRNYDLTFLNDSITLTNKLQKRLLYIKNNRSQAVNQYAQPVKGVRNMRFDTEKLYADMALPDEDYRLLALFRYWNIIHYFFPYKYAIDGNWNDVLSDFIPLFREATTEQAYQNALYRLIACIDDSHGFFKSTVANRCLRCDLGRLWLPFDLKLIDGKAVVTQLYNDSLISSPLLTVGAVISHIDGEAIQTRINRLRPYVAASNQAALLRDLRWMIHVGVEAEARVTFYQNGQDTTLTIKRYPYSRFDKRQIIALNDLNPVSKWLNDSVSYVNLGHLENRQVDSVMKPLMRAKRIVFDLRNYPKGTYWLVARYLTDGFKPFVMFTEPDPKTPGVFRQSATQKLPKPSRRQAIFTGKVVVLINEETQSLAEFTAMAFKLVPGVTFVGSPTAGADGNISWIPLPGGYETAFSGIGVYYPDGHETQRVGIQPNVFVRPTLEGIRNGRDEVLERAINWPGN